MDKEGMSTEMFVGIVITLIIIIIGLILSGGFSRMMSKILGY